MGLSETPKAPKAPKFYPIDIPATLAQAIQFDVQGYDSSDADFVSRFPGLVASREQTIEDAFNQLTGPVDPTVENTFTQSAITKALSQTGGGNPMAGIEKGSAAQNTAGVQLANSLQQKQDYDRSYFQSLIETNPERAFGLSGSDVANLSIANTTGLNSSSQQNYTNTLAGIAAQGAAGVQTGQAIAGLGSIFTSLSGALYNRPTYTGSGGSGFSDARLKKNLQQVGVSPSGIPIYHFEYIAGKGLPEGTFQGVLAQDLLQIKPDAVEYHLDGIMTVDYTMIDVKHVKL